MLYCKVLYFEENAYTKASDQSHGMQLGYNEDVAMHLNCVHPAKRSETTSQAATVSMRKVACNRQPDGHPPRDTPLHFGLQWLYARQDARAFAWDWNSWTIRHFRSRKSS